MLWDGTLTIFVRFPVPTIEKLGFRLNYYVVVLHNTVYKYMCIRNTVQSHEGRCGGASSPFLEEKIAFCKI